MSQVHWPLRGMGIRIADATNGTYLGEHVRYDPQPGARPKVRNALLRVAVLAALQDMRKRRIRR